MTKLVTSSNRDEGLKEREFTFSATLTLLSPSSGLKVPNISSRAEKTAQDLFRRKQNRCKHVFCVSIVLLTSDHKDTNTREGYSRDQPEFDRSMVWDSGKRKIS